MTGQPIDLMKVLVGSLSTEQRATIETPVPFPRAQYGNANAYFPTYRHDCTALMRAWVVREVASFWNLYPPTRETTAEDERDALLVAEQLAAEEIRRPLNPNEIRLLGEVVRDVLCAAIITQDTEQARQAELSSEVL